jgi:cell division transport system permease protein
MTSLSKSLFSPPQSHARFDLPLHTRLGTEYIRHLIALMSFLLFICASLFFLIQNFTSQWTQGLASSLTVEIPSAAAQDEDIEKFLSELRDISPVEKAEIVETETIKNRLAPWLGNDILELAELPLPKLITIHLKERNDDIVLHIETLAKEHFSDARVDAHDQWLADLVSLTATIQYCALGLMIMIGVITSLSVSGGVRARMAIHQSELELLHVMGASDSYIVKQFQKYVVILALQGLLLGFGVFALTVAIFSFTDILNFSAQGSFVMAPNFLLSLGLIIAALLLVCVIAARKTAFQVLKTMP